MLSGLEPLARFVTAGSLQHLAEGWEQLLPTKEASHPLTSEGFNRRRN